MPTRLLREGILDSTAVNSLSFPAEVFYRRLMSIVDDFGRFDGRPAVLRGRLYALKLDSVKESDINKWVEECERADLVSRYSVDGKQFLLFKKLGIPRARQSKYPAPSAEAKPAQQTQTDVNGCAQTQTPDCGCEQPFTGAPYSYSYSDSYSGSSAPAEAGIAVAIPAELDTEEFRIAWGEWKADRQERGLKKYTSRGESKALKDLAKYGPTVAIRAIHKSICNQWQGLFPEKEAAASNKGLVEQTREALEGFLSKGDSDEA